MYIRFLDFSGNAFEMPFDDSGSGYTVTKIILIEALSVSTGTTGKSVQQTVEEELKEAGVDITDYHQVADYYGLAN